MGGSAAGLVYADDDEGRVGVWLGDDEVCDEGAVVFEVEGDVGGEAVFGIAEGFDEIASGCLADFFEGCVGHLLPGYVVGEQRDVPSRAGTGTCGAQFGAGWAWGLPQVYRCDYTLWFCKGVIRGGEQSGHPSGELEQSIDREGPGRDVQRALLQLGCAQRMVGNGGSRRGKVS